MVQTVTLCIHYGLMHCVRGDARHGRLCRMDSAADKEVAQNLACERCSNGCKCDTQCDCGPTCTCSRYIEHPSYTAQTAARSYKLQNRVKNPYMSAFNSLPACPRQCSQCIPMGCCRCNGRRGFDPENECAHCMGGNCDCQTPENCKNPTCPLAPLLPPALGAFHALPVCICES